MAVKWIHIWFNVLSYPIPMQPRSTLYDIEENQLHRTYSQKQKKLWCKHARTRCVTAIPSESRVNYTIIMTKLYLSFVLAPHLLLLDSRLLFELQLLIFGAVGIYFLFDCEKTNFSFRNFKSFCSNSSVKSYTAFG